MEALVENQAWKWGESKVVRDLRQLPNGIWKTAPLDAIAPGAGDKILDISSETPAPSHLQQHQEN